MAWLRSLRASLPELSVSGGTSSIFRPPVFDGFYFSADRGRWIEEQVSVLFVDIPYEGDVLNDFVHLLEFEFSSCYLAQNSGQDEIGISVSELLYTSYG